VTGTEEVVANFKRFGKMSESAMGNALESEAHVILNLSKQIVPTKTGTLKSTGRVDPPKRSHGTVVVDMKYGGGPAADYAVKQHEDMDLRHKPGEQAKFLEAPAKARAENITIKAATEVLEAAEML